MFSYIKILTNRHILAFLTDKAWQPIPLPLEHKKQSFLNTLVTDLVEDMVQTGEMRWKMKDEQQKFVARIAIG